MRGLAVGVVLLLLGCDQPNSCEETLQCVGVAPFPSGEGSIDERWECIEASRENDLDYSLYAGTVRECKVLAEIVPTEDCEAWLERLTFEEVECAF